MTAPRFGKPRQRVEGDQQGFLLTELVRRASSEVARATKLINDERTGASYQRQVALSRLGFGGA